MRTYETRAASAKRPLVPEPSSTPRPRATRLPTPPVAADGPADQIDALRLQVSHLEHKLFIAEDDNKFLTRTVVRQQEGLVKQQEGMEDMKAQLSLMKGSHDALHSVLQGVVERFNTAIDRVVTNEDRLVIVEVDVERLQEESRKKKMKKEKSSASSSAFVRPFP